MILNYTCRKKLAAKFCITFWFLATAVGLAIFVDLHHSHCFQLSCCYIILTEKSRAEKTDEVYYSVTDEYNEAFSEEVIGMESQTDCAVECLGGGLIDR